MARGKEREKKGTKRKGAQLSRAVPETEVKKNKKSTNGGIVTRQRAMDLCEVKVEGPSTRATTITPVVCHTKRDCDAALQNHGYALCKHSDQKIAELREKDAHKVMK